MTDALERRIRAFERDRRSGAAQLAREALAIVQVAERQGLRTRGLELLRRTLVAAHPTMAAVWNAMHAPDPAAFRHRITAGWQHAARNARRVLRGARTVLTLSYSSTVVAALERRRHHVIVGQSLPGGEGERTVRALRRRGTLATVVPDATLAAWVAVADAVVLGADAVTRRGVINKVGSRVLALAAHVGRRPCYVVADSSKFPLPSFPFPLPPLGPGDLFEYIELELITRVISERGGLSGAAVKRLLMR